jgi:hypothetical protein
MSSAKSSSIFPCTVFFADGRVLQGVLALLMQLTLVLWPVAAIWAKQTGESSGMEKALADLAQEHKLDPYARPAKKFRQTA